MDLNLKDMSLVELKALQKDVAKAISDYEVRKKKEALKAVAELADKHGFSIAELLDSVKSKDTAKAPKFRHKDNPELTWTGRGRRPAWFESAEPIEEQQ